MEKVTRNPKTGRFMSKSNIETVTVNKLVKSTGKAPIKETIDKAPEEITLLINSLSVFSKKAMDGKPSNIKAGTQVILTPVGDAIRVKKLNSSRTFYTNSEAVEAAL